MITCRACSSDNPETAPFCQECGEPFAVPCPECGTILPSATTKFCPECGARLAREDADSEQMLKLVTILFADVVSSTTRAEQMFPDEVRELMSDFFEAMVQEIRGEGGRIEKFIGDAVMAVFGVPRAHEDDPVRAVRAARRMLARLERWNEGREDLHQIRIRIGVNTGSVLAAAPGSDLMVTGDAVNVAARLEQSAENGTIVIGQRTARAVRSFFVLRDLEPLTLKGKAEPVPAFLVADEKELPGTRETYGFVAPLIGRDDELETLRATLRAVEEQGRPELVTIEADAGVGKSRLVRDFAASVSDHTRVVSGRCLPYGEGITLWPLGEILRAESGVLLTDPPELVIEKLQKIVKQSIPGELAPEPERTVAGLATTIGLAHDAGVSIGDPRQRHQELLAAWRALFTAMATDAPLVVIIEDVHWADATMLEALEHFVAELPAPVMFLCPTRPDFYVTHPEWKESRERYTRAVLEPLGESAIGALMAALLQESELPDKLQAAVLKKCEGNPFFLEEILNRLVDDGLLTERDGRWIAVPDIQELDIPDNVQAVILARIDLLPHHAKRVLQTAAVVGRAFWDGTLRHINSAVDVDEILEDLQHRGFIFRLPASSMAGQTEYLFKHILIADVAYESLPRNRRGKAHVGVAEWVKTISGERADELAELIAHHYHQAFDYSKQDDYREEARELYCTAATRACSRFAMQQAETYGWLAVDMSQAGGQRIETLERLGDVYSVGFAMDAAWKVYRDAVWETLRTQPANPDAVGRLAAKAAIVPTRYEATLRERPNTEVLNQIISTGIEAVGDTETRELATLLASKAIMQAFGYEEMDEQGEEAARAAVEIAERINDPDLLSSALDATTYWLAQEGLYGQINAISRRRVDLIPHLTNLTEICDVHVVGTWSSLYVGRYRDGAEHANSTIELAKDTEPGSYFYGLVMRVYARFMIGDWDGALNDQATIEKLQSGEHELPPRHASISYAFVMLIYRLRGQIPELNKYEEIIRRMDDEYQVSGRATTLRAVWARVLAHRGDATAARELLLLERSPFLCGHLEALCDVLVSQEDWNATPAALEAARSEAARAELIALPLYADRLEGVFLAAMKEWSESVASLARSAEGFEALQAPWEVALSRLKLGETLAASGDPVGARRELTKSLDVFERLGSIAEIERNKRLLTSI